ncbi:hypothetical protein [Rhodococcus sp. LW-XY12]|uniref:hypothetical protein n=1 Tax=Rhodococcus sp. LW-XY12 TaxID=2856851 RepID=UPI001C59F82A|nr:hypothetical protein [Rhodococcus sp. LW-XY12]QXU53962.1 hypothetical protein KXC42_01140 [Rhodococcus sp. LW-XY12]
MRLVVHRSRQKVTTNPGTDFPILFEFSGVAIAMRPSEALALADQLVDAAEQLREGRA